MSTATPPHQESPSSATPRFRVLVVDEATIVERGERVRVWFLPFRDSWLRAKDHPDAVLEEESSDQQSPRCPPGTIWTRSIELLLPRGTPLLSRTTSPLLERMAPMEYLTKERRGMRRKVSETWFVVSGNYRLTRSKEPDIFTQARKSHEEKSKGKRA